MFVRAKALRSQARTSFDILFMDYYFNIYHLYSERWPINLIQIDEIRYWNKLGSVPNFINLFYIDCSSAWNIMRHKKINKNQINNTKLSIIFINLHKIDGTSARNTIQNTNIARNVCANALHLPRVTLQPDAVSQFIAKLCDADALALAKCV